jgi:DedD protein
MSDDAFHEIQLNGKQLVFLFMAATVVSVVIFLCGVMVGRGVRAERGGADAAAAETAAATSSPERGSPSPPETQTPGPQASNQAQQLPAEAPPTPPEDSGDDVYSQMEKGDTRDTLKTRGTGKKPAPALQKLEPVRQETAQKTAPKAAPPPVDPAPAKPTPAKPAAKPDQMPGAAGAFAVQIAALKDRGEADAIARRLVGKGYQAYVLAPAGSRAPVYKVQVGRFKNRQDAERTAARLKKEEQFSPWVTR